MGMRESEAVVEMAVDWRLSTRNLIQRRSGVVDGVVSGRMCSGSSDSSVGKSTVLFKLRIAKGGVLGGQDNHDGICIEMTQAANPLEVVEYRPEGGSRKSSAPMNRSFRCSAHCKLHHAVSPPAQHRRCGHPATP